MFRTLCRSFALALSLSPAAALVLYSAADSRLVQASIPDHLPPQISEQQPAAGKFLVASESIRDPRFRHTVILLLSHGEEGTLGLIINRPSRIPLSDAISADIPPGQLHYGGPVRPTAISLLVDPGADGDAPEKERSVVIDDIYYVFGKEAVVDELSRVNAGVSLRVYAGYAGWAPGQLESEIRSGGWYLTSADADAIFAVDTGQLWDNLIRRLRGRWI